MEGKSLNDVFKSFCAGKTEMESKQFSKLIKECKLTDKKFGINDIDIVFAKDTNNKPVGILSPRPSKKLKEKILRHPCVARALTRASLSGKHLGDAPC